MIFRKILLYLLIACCITLNANSQSKICIIKGIDQRIRGNFSGEMDLSGIEEGNRVRIASVLMDSTHNFMIAAAIKKEGFYYLSDKSNYWLVPIYLKPGDKTELNINKDKGWELVNGSEENKVMQEWSVVSEPATNMIYENNAYIRNKALSFKIFLENYTSVQPIVEAFVNKTHTGNTVFNEWFSLFAKEQMEYAAFKIMLTPIEMKLDPVTHETIKDTNNPKLPKAQYYIPFYKQFLEEKKFCDARILRFCDANMLLFGYEVIKTRLMSVEERKQFNGGKLQEKLNLFCNDTIKGAYLLSKLSQYKSYDAMKDEIGPLENYFVTDHMKEVYANKQKSLYKSWLLKGSAAMAFTLEDNHGKTVTMDDFKGKLVYVDIWATWCAPCKAELPFLKKTEEKFADKNIVFVSVTIDKEKDKQKWMDMIEKEKLGGVQLFGGEGGAFQKFYNATSIPRFLLIDANGKIISVTAPRPSNSELEKQLSALLLQ